MIDIGTAAIRMAISEIGADQSIRQLESLTQAVDLGKDTFDTGEIRHPTIEECVDVLRSYRQKLDEYKIVVPDDVRVIATSSVREAANQLTFEDRVYVATGLSVQILDAAEIHRIMYRGVQPLLKARPHLFQSLSFLTEVGGGNTELLLLDDGNVSWTQAYRLGSLRLKQILETSHVPRSKMRQIMETEIHSQLEGITELIPPGREINMVAMGGDIRFAARKILNEQFATETFSELPVADLSEFIDYVFSRSEEKLVSEYHITFSSAKTVGAALLTYLRLAEILKLERIYATGVNLRNGLVRDLAEGSRWTEDFRKQIVRSAMEFARKYDVDLAHANSVAKLARQLFEQLVDLHRLDQRYETLLYAAALLHEVGGYVNTSSIHKHSMYLIMNSPLFGLTSADLQLVALIARYHRRALPKPTHTVYSGLDRDRRVAVSKLAAILRIARALDASRTQRVGEIECRKRRNRLVISVPNVDDLSAEQIALRSGRQFFQSVYGLDVLLRAQQPALESEPSSQL